MLNVRLQDQAYRNTGTSADLDLRSRNEELLLEKSILMSPSWLHTTLDVYALYSLTSLPQDTYGKSTTYEHSSCKLPHAYCIRLISLDTGTNLT